MSNNLDEKHTSLKNYLIKNLEISCLVKITLKNDYLAEIYKKISRMLLPL